MFDSIITKVILGWIRHMVGVAGGGLVTSGLLTSDQANQAVGAVMVIVPLAFSAYDKYQAQQSTAKAVQGAKQ